MSIVHVLAPAPYGGLESVVATLASGQREAGDTVCVAVVLSGKAQVHPFVETVERRGVEVAVLRVGARQYLRERREVRGLLARLGAQVLHTHGYRPDVVDGPVARAMGVFSATTVHGFTGGGGARGHLYEWLQVRAFRRFDAVIAVSQALRGELVRAGVPPHRVHTVRNAWESLGALMSRADARASLGISEGDRVVAWVGRMSPEKAPDIMIRAFAATSSRVRLSMIGSGVLEGECRALASALGVSERVRWHGVIPNAGLHLRAFDAVALTSWTEGTPMLLLEAMGAGVPIITTSVGGVPESVGPAHARLVAPGDIVALAGAIDEVFFDRPGAAARASAARLRIENELAVRPWVERHRQIYQRLTEIDER